MTNDLQKRYDEPINPRRLIDLQQRYREVGRARMGEQKATGKGNTKRPAKLLHWRLTSPRLELLEDAAAAYGGTPRVWKDAPNEGETYELYTESTTLHIAIVPGDTMTQAYELWNRGGCQRRCLGGGPGNMQLDSNRPCVCPAEIGERMAEAAKGKACSPHTRFSFVIDEVRDFLGLWRLETHGYNAAGELPRTFDALRKMVKPGTVIPAALRIEPRSKVAEGKTSRFIVPVLQTDFTLREARTELEATYSGPALPPMETERRSLPGAPPPKSTDPGAEDIEDAVVVEQAHFPDAPVPAPAGDAMEASDLAPWILRLPESLNDGDIIDAANILLKERGSSMVVDSPSQLNDASQDFAEELTKRLQAFSI